MKRIILNALIVIALSACAHSPHFSEVAPYFNWIQPTSTESSLAGRAYFWPAPSGEEIKIQISLTGAIPEKKYFAFIHEVGSCFDEARTAGPIFNPLASHWSFKPIPSGFLGEMNTSGEGIVDFEKLFKTLSFGSGKNNIEGRSIVISTDRESVARVGCAVIPVLPREGQAAN